MSTATLDSPDPSRPAAVDHSDPSRSALDPDWPPAPPPRGKAAEVLQYLIEKKIDVFYRVLRAMKPIFALPKGGPVFITRFRDVQEVLERPTVFQVMYAPMIDRSVGKFMLAHDGTVYNQRDKGIMRSLLQVSDLPAVKEKVGEIAERCIEEGYADGRLEVVSNLSRKAPVLLTGEYFGFPGPDLESMFRWSRATQYDMFHNQAMSGAVHDDNLRAGEEMQAYLSDELIPRRKAELEKNPDLDDTVSRLLKMDLPDSIGFDEGRLLPNIMGLLVGGVETTSQAIVQIVDQLLRRPKALEGARRAAHHDDDHLVYRYCWEALRFNPINPFVMRQCSEDYRVAAGTFRNKKIKAGRVVLVATRSAMMDGREIPRPRKFRVDRPDYHYMHLGYGMHRCLGDEISKVQVPEIVKRLLLKKNLRRAPGQAGEIDYDGGPFPERFSVTFDR